MPHINEGPEAQETTGRTVVGLFGDRASAEAALRELKASGFTDAQIGIATLDRHGEQDLPPATAGVSERDARHFEAGLRAGGTLVTVSAGPRTREALALLERYGMDFGPSGIGRHGRSRPAGASPPYTGRERRAGRDVAYAGPERRRAAARA